MATEAIKYTNNEHEFHGGLKRLVRDEDRDEPYNGASNEGVEIHLLDRMITSFRLEELEADIWLEDDRDICLHLLPSRGALSFDNYTNFVRPQLDKIFRKIFGGVCSAQCDEYGWRYGDPNVSRKSDRNRKGMDLVCIRLFDLYNRPHAEKKTIDAVRLLDQVLCGKEAPME